MKDYATGALIAALVLCPLWVAVIYYATSR